MPRKNVTIGKRQLALDARPDRLDLRDRPFRPRLGSLPPQYPGDADIAEWLPKYASYVLDQGEDGACTGFGLAAVINYLLFTGALAAKSTAIRQVSPAMLYELARLYDEWPGEDYEGSSCRGALKGWHRHGVCQESLWPYRLRRGKRIFAPPLESATYPDDPDANWDLDALRCTLGVYYRIDPRSVVDMQAAIVETGAIYVSGNVHEGWDVDASSRLRGHADLAQIEYVAKPKDDGGHAFALVGYNERGFVVQNSWGRTWGSKGFALQPYEDWVRHGEDAWVFTLGAARPVEAKDRAGRAGRSPRFFVPYTDAGGRKAPDRPVGLVGSGVDAFSRKYRGVPAAVQPLETDQAYRHAVVLDRGFPVRNDITSQDPASALEAASLTRPLEWMKANKSHKLLIYAHGGLNSESESISRVRAIAPYAIDAGIYPLFITWRSGPLETISDLVEEAFARLGFGARGAEPARGWADRITDRTDRMLETWLRAPGAALWGQMKLNAERASSHADGGARLMVGHLKALAREIPKLEIHLIGHSAGAIVLGALLDRLKEARLPAATLRLFAPACTARFALDHYRPAVSGRIVDPAHWYIHVLSDDNEKDDSVGPYRKSLLYLVSRSFEDVHKTPLLGLDQLFDAGSTSGESADGMWASSSLKDATGWLDFWTTLKTDRTHRLVLDRRTVSTGSQSIQSAHGCFDNAVDIMGDALGYIVNPKAPKRVKIHRLDY
jgi:hypothetical protein